MNYWKGVLLYIWYLLIRRKELDVIRSRGMRGSDRQFPRYDHTPIETRGQFWLAHRDPRL
jgi:hypothetical protein